MRTTRVDVLALARQALVAAVVVVVVVGIVVRVVSFSDRTISRRFSVTGAQAVTSAGGASACGLRERIHACLCRCAESSVSSDDHSEFGSEDGSNGEDGGEGDADGSDDEHGGIWNDLAYLKGERDDTKREHVVHGEGDGPALVELLARDLPNADGHVDSESDHDEFVSYE